MHLNKPIAFKIIIKRISPALWIGAASGLAIVFFDAVNILVEYRYLRLDFYLCSVALLFLVAGIAIKSKSSSASKPFLPPENALDLLSSKEQSVFKLIAAGKTNKEIAAVLFIELSTVKTHVNHIYSKISVRNRLEARRKFVELTGSRVNS